MFWKICYGLISFSWIMLEVKCQLRDNTPPTMWLDNRYWEIPESESVGSRISQAHARDSEGDRLIFSLEPFRLRDPKLPFRIDPDTGTIYLNDSLQGRAGENVRLFVTVSDGVVPAKYEILVNIVKESTSSSSPLSLFNAHIINGQPKNGAVPDLVKVEEVKTDLKEVKKETITVKVNVTGNSTNYGVKFSPNFTIVSIISVYVVFLIPTRHYVGGF